MISIPSFQPHRLISFGRHYLQPSNQSHESGSLPLRRLSPSPPRPPSHDLHLLFQSSSMTFLLFIFLLSLPSQNPTSAQCLESQKSSLLTLFPSLQNLSWTPTTDCCYWKGVACDASTGHVTSLDLTNRSISVRLNSTALLSLTSLRALNLSLNLFNSSIPGDIFGLSNLTHLNLSNSGLTGPVPVEISRLKALVSLDLSTSSLSLFEPLRISSSDLGFLVGNLSGLREIYLDGVVVSSPVPESLVGLVNLRNLHLGSCNLTGEFPWKIFRLWNLETLDVSSNPFLTGTLPEFPMNSSLRILTLSGSNFFGKLPSSIGNLRSLERLQLGKCNFSGQIPRPVFDISSLVHLDISSNGFIGEIQSLGNLARLVYLDLSANKLRGSIPSLDNLTQLVHLDLSWNSLSGQIPSMGALKNVIEVSLSNNNLSGVINSSFGDELHLTRLYLNNNSLSGKIPSSLFSLSSLKLLQLSHNHFDDQLDEFHRASSSLNTLDLSYNKLKGPIPSSISKLAGLNVLILASNSFSGVIDLAMLQNLKNLSSLDLSDNPLSINDTSTDPSSFPKVGTLKLRSCNLTKFPDFLKTQSNLFTLDLSNNQIGGTLPDWLWEIGNLSLAHLNISYNKLTGQVPLIDVVSSKLTLLDLHSNKLQGSIPLPPRSAIIVDYSHNNFTSVIPPNISSFLAFTIFFSLSSNKIRGEIPLSICNASFLQVLDLSNNTLSGMIPPCLGQMSSNLQVLNLGKNNLVGTIPQSFVDGCSLKTLNLNGNQLEGSLPMSLANCMQLEVLNLGNNRIKDTFPSWLGSLHQLRVLVLRSNNFYGLIGPQEDEKAFEQLQIIDLSSNGFTGNLSSKCFERWKGMTVDEDEKQSKLRHQILEFGFLVINPLYYRETITITIKSLDMELLKILTIFTSMDLSKNNFQGNIPQEIGNLKSLYMLNMSHNKFTGPIPSSFGRLRQLESLDLSVNQLSGEIPKELTALTFLSFLNVSENNFVGSIPQGNQFSTFSNESFEENARLCGPPLTKKCEAMPESRIVNLQSKITFDPEIIWIGLGFGGGLGMIFGPLVFWRKGRRWYNAHVDKIYFMVMPEGTWSLIDCNGARIEPEEKVEQELSEFESEIEMEDEEQYRQRFCVFCSQIDVGWRRAIHKECSCPDSSPLISSQGSLIAEKYCCLFES